LEGEVVSTGVASRLALRLGASMAMGISVSPRPLLERFSLSMDLPTKEVWMRERQHPTIRSSCGAARWLKRVAIARYRVWCYSPPTKEHGRLLPYCVIVVGADFEGIAKQKRSSSYSK